MPSRKLFRLLAENNGFGSCIHRLDDRERFKAIAEISDASATILKSLFDNDSDALDGCARRFGDRNEPLKRASVCQKVVDYKQTIVA